MRIIMRHLYLGIDYRFSVNAIVKYYYLIYSYIIKKFINGFLLKPYDLHIFLDFHKLHKCLTFLKKSSFSSIDALVDLVVIDRPSNVNKRFELIYSF